MKLRLLLTLFLTFNASLFTLMAQDFKFDEVTYTPQQTTFRLFAPADAKKVVVRIYKEGQGGKALKRPGDSGSLAAAPHPARLSRPTAGLSPMTPNIKRSLQPLH